MKALRYPYRYTETETETKTETETERDTKTKTKTKTERKTAIRRAANRQCLGSGNGREWALERVAVTKGIACRKELLEAGMEASQRSRPTPVFFPCACSRDLHSQCPFGLSLANSGFATHIVS